MKDKTLTGLLALFLGTLGVHRFYLGQTKLGVLYLILLFTGISAILGLIDAVLFLTMDQEKFDDKYNNNEYFDRPPRRRTSPQQRRNSHPKYIDHRKQSRDPRRNAPVVRKKNPYKLSGIQKYKDYDFEGAIADFKKALAVDGKDIAVHFNLACAYSITEQADKALYHLDSAVKNGFVDFDKIKEHDALAYLRIQDEFEAFEKNGFCLDEPQAPVQATAPEANEDLSISTDLLEQIKKLGELREKGFLTEEEFSAQKKRLLR
ncbi:MAG: NINE protein [Bacteroidota bacterium]